MTENEQTAKEKAPKNVVLEIHNLKHIFGTTVNKPERKEESHGKESK